MCFRKSNLLYSQLISNSHGSFHTLRKELVHSYPSNAPSERSLVYKHPKFFGENWPNLGRDISESWYHSYINPCLCNEESLVIIFNNFIITTVFSNMAILQFYFALCPLNATTNTAYDVMSNLRTNDSYELILLNIPQVLKKP